jgi:hypothetical protein
MAENGSNIANLIKAGKMNLDELKATLGESAASSLVSITDWGVCYSSGTGQLSEYATVTSNNSGNPIIGIGMIAYTSDGSSMLAVQYTNDISSPSVATSIGTTLYTPQMGNEILCVIYGWTVNGNFYQSQTIATVPCS